MPVFPAPTELPANVPLPVKPDPLTPKMNESAFAAGKSTKANANALTTKLNFLLVSPTVRFRGRFPWERFSGGCTKRWPSDQCLLQQPAAHAVHLHEIPAKNPHAFGVACVALWS